MMAGIRRGIGKLLRGLLLAVLAVHPASAETVRAAGTGMGLALVRLLAEQFGREHPGSPVWVPQSVGSSGAVKGLAAGKLDVGILARPLAPGEVAGARSVELCRTPLTFFVNAARSDVTLSQSDLEALFASRLPAFSGGEVRMLLRPANDTNFIRLLEFYPQLAPVVATARGMRGANLALTDQDAMDTVEASHSLVGFGPLAPILAEKRDLVPVPLDGVLASAETLASGRYPHDVTLVLALSPNASADARAFVAYAKSPAAAPLLRANACLPVAGGLP